MTRPKLSCDPRSLVLCSLILGAAATRLLPHPPNFTAAPALALFAGAAFASPWTALLVPLLAMLLSDLALAAFVYGPAALSSIPLVYAAVVLTVGIGRALPRVSASAVAGGAVGSALVFYVVTNLGVWASGRLYPLTLEGLAACYVAALPFLGSMLAGNLLWSGVLFGGFAWLERRVPALAAPPRRNP